MARKPVTSISTEDRFRFGEFSIPELCVLKACGPTKVYEDIKVGRLPSLKRGRNRRIAGPIAKRYAPGVGLLPE
jgi:hypothetical protein